MPTGLKIPVRVNKSGGAAVETNESEQLKKLLFLAFSSGDDENPFQTLGILGDLVFSINDAAFRSRALREVERILAKFKDRVSLAPDEPIKFEDLGDGEIEMSFEYVDLLTNSPEEFRKRFKG